MRTAGLLPLLLISLPLACSDDDGGDDNAAGRAGSNAGGAAGASGGGGRGGAAGRGTAGSSGLGGSAGSAGSSGAAGAAGSGGAAGAAGSSASGGSDCERLCARPLGCPDTRAECLSSCEDGVELCPDESEALFECEETLSDDDFQCIGGVPIPDDDLCVPESSAFARCRIGF